VKFGGGIGAGWQMKQWNARVNLHSQTSATLATG